MQPSPELGGGAGILVLAVLPAAVAVAAVVIAFRLLARARRKTEPSEMSPLILRIAAGSALLLAFGIGCCYAAMLGFGPG